MLWIMVGMKLEEGWMALATIENQIGNLVVGPRVPPTRPPYIDKIYVLDLKF